MQCLVDLEGRVLSKMKLFVVLVAIFAVAAAAPSETDSLLTSTLRFARDCGDKSIFLCMKVPTCSVAALA